MEDHHAKQRQSHIVIGRDDDSRVTDKVLRLLHTHGRDVDVYLHNYIRHGILRGDTPADTQVEVSRAIQRVDVEDTFSKVSRKRTQDDEEDFLIPYSCISTFEDLKTAALKRKEGEGKRKRRRCKWEVDLLHEERMEKVQVDEDEEDKVGTSEEEEEEDELVLGTPETLSMDGVSLVSFFDDVDYYNNSPNETQLSNVDVDVAQQQQQPHSSTDLVVQWHCFSPVRGDGDESDGEEEEQCQEVGEES